MIIYIITFFNCVSRYKNAVQHRSELMKDQPMSPQETVVYWTEYVIRHKGAKHLRSPVLDMTWWVWNWISFHLLHTGNCNQTICWFITIVILLTIYNKNIIFACIHFQDRSLQHRCLGDSSGHCCCLPCSGAPPSEMSFEIRCQEMFWNERQKPKRKENENKLNKLMKLPCRELHSLQTGTYSSICTTNSFHYINYYSLLILLLGRKLGR